MKSGLHLRQVVVRCCSQMATVWSHARKGSAAKYNCPRTVCGGAQKSLTDEPRSCHDPGQVWLTLAVWQGHPQLGWLLRRIDHVSSCFLSNPFSYAVSPQVPVVTVTGPCPSAVLEVRAGGTHWPRMPSHGAVTGVL